MPAGLSTRSGDRYTPESHPIDKGFGKVLSPFLPIPQPSVFRYGIGNSRHVWETDPRKLQKAEKNEK